MNYDEFGSNGVWSLELLYCSTSKTVFGSIHLSLLENFEPMLLMLRRVSALEGDCLLVIQASDDQRDVGGHEQ